MISYIQKAILKEGAQYLGFFNFFSRNASFDLHLACAFFSITCKDDDFASSSSRSFPTRRRRGRSREKRRVVIEFSRFSEMSIRPTRGVSEN